MIPVIDVFAGPGGLNEGFARHEEGSTFSVVASFEMESNAIETLKLRSAVRSLSPNGVVYGPYGEALNRNALTSARVASDVLRDDLTFQEALVEAGGHVFQHELSEGSREVSDKIIRQRLQDAPEKWVLIGGPPCQAYSLVGRSRRTGETSFYEDVKHTLYREYLHIVEDFKPTVFVMENVKGLLSARTAKGKAGVGTFELILQDMRRLGYTLYSLVVEGEAPAHSDFVIRAERYGVPQRRHRVILLGVRDDEGLGTPGTLELDPRPQTVGTALSDLPVIRSLVSRGDDEHVWSSARTAAHAAVRRTVIGGKPVKNVPAPCGLPPVDATAYRARASSTALMQWLRPQGLTHVTQHASRSHMRSDLERYAYLALLAGIGHFPRVTDLPEGMRPAHKNLSAASVPFVDRFKVQVKDRPSSTVASHISKDGHYYIHPDPDQMRSLTVREAARLQTFPDDYYFMGNRTAQYHQVGNAVPPWLALQIAGVVAQLLGE